MKDFIVLTIEWQLTSSTGRFRGFSWPKRWCHFGIKPLQPKFSMWGNVCSPLSCKSCYTSPSACTSGGVQKPSITGRQLELMSDYNSGVVTLPLVTWGEKNDEQKKADKINRHRSIFRCQAWQRSAASRSYANSPGGSASRPPPQLSERDACSLALTAEKGATERGQGHHTADRTEEIKCATAWNDHFSQHRQRCQRVYASSPTNWKPYLCFAGLQLLLPLLVFHRRGPCGWGERETASCEISAGEKERENNAELAAKRLASAF